MGAHYDRRLVSDVSPPDDGHLFHIADRGAWSRAVDTFAPPEAVDEGFVHLSRLDQVLVPAHRWYRGRSDLVLLELDPARLGAPVVWEPGTDTDEVFPHLYGAIDTDAVVAVHDFPCAADGTFSLPEALT